MHCVEGVSGQLAELRSMPSLRVLALPASCTEREADAEAVYAPTLDTLFIERPVEHAGEWKLDLSRLTSLYKLDLDGCSTIVTDASAGGEPPDRPHRAQPRRLYQRDRRGATHTEQPHSSRVPLPRRLLQRDHHGVSRMDKGRDTKGS